MGFSRYVCNWETIYFGFSVFFDGRKFVILLTGFQKKSQKTPSAEIEKAVRLMEEYYEEKNGEASR
jgi:hypothetical protein